MLNFDNIDCLYFKKILYCDYKQYRISLMNKISIRNTIGKTHLREKCRRSPVKSGKIYYFFDVFRQNEHKTNIL